MSALLLCSAAFAGALGGFYLEAVAVAPIGPLDAVGVLGEANAVARMEMVTAALDDAAELLELRLF